MENQSTNQNWEKLVLEQETSGLTQNEYCKQKGIKIDAFKYHRSKHKNIVAFSQTASYNGHCVSEYLESNLDL